MYDEHDFDPAFLARYFAGECSHEEARQFEQWIAERPERQASLDELRDAWRIMGELPRESYDLESAWAKVRPGARRPDLRLVTDKPQPQPQSRRQLRSRRRRGGIARRLALAASVVLAVAGSVTSYQLLRDRTESLATADPTVHTISSEPGQRISVRLADGTQVLLAPASTLRFAATYGARDRVVELTGEAAFTVEHDDRRPFIVHTPRLVAHDLGTRFIVKAYAEDAAEEVVVAEGKVAVSRATSTSDSSRPDTSSVLLTRGDGVRAGSDGELALTRGLALDSYFAWTEGRLVFRRTLLGDAVQQLERWHDIEIELAAADLAELGFTASFSVALSVDETLDVVTSVLDLETERTGPRSFTLIRRGR